MNIKKEEIFFTFPEIIQIYKQLDIGNKLSLKNDIYKLIDIVYTDSFNCYCIFKRKSDKKYFKMDWTVYSSLTFPICNDSKNSIYEVKRLEKSEIIYV